MENEPKGRMLNKDYIDANARIFIAVYDQMYGQMTFEGIVKLVNNYMVVLYGDDYLKGGKPE